MAAKRSKRKAAKRRAKKVRLIGRLPAAAVKEIRRTANVLLLNLGAKRGAAEAMKYARKATTAMDRFCWRVVAAALTTRVKGG